MKENMLTNFYDTNAKRFKKAIYPDNTNDLTVDSRIYRLLLSKVLSKPTARK